VKHYYNIHSHKHISHTYICILFHKKTKTDAEIKQWCVANKEAPDDVLQAALESACQHGGADCSKIKPNNPCFLPNTIKDHASFVFNIYYQNYKHKGGFCYFNRAAMITDRDP
ncbi:hypothetical protein EUTSA_v10003112mg, partial [Eutrema salsugineum]